MGNLTFKETVYQNIRSQVEARVRLISKPTGKIVITDSMIDRFIRELTLSLTKSKLP